MATYLWPTTIIAAQSGTLDTCITSGAQTPSVGLYSLVHDNGRRLCIAPSDDSDGTIVPCLLIGRIHVGQLRADVEAWLGEPWRRLGPRDERVATDVYLVFQDSVTDRGAYYVVEYEEVDGGEIAYSVQLTQDDPGPGHGFSCLALGDSVNAVTRQLGAPSEVTAFAIEEQRIRGVVWWFDPDPVSIEIVDGRVYSFRVWRPDDAPAEKRILSLLQQP